MDDVVILAKNYLAQNAAESGADELIRDLVAEVESLRKQFLDGVTSILAKAKETNEIVKNAEARLDRAGL